MWVVYYSFMSPYKIADRAVIGLFSERRKETGRDLAVFAMIKNAGATGALPGTWLIATIAICKILFLIRTIFHAPTSF